MIRSRQVPVFEGVTKDIFLAEVYPKRQPAILRDVSLGPASDLWTAEYIAGKVGDRPVKVHVCPTDKMDFLTKNFAYKWASRELITAIHWYNRSDAITSIGEQTELR